MIEKCDVHIVDGKYVVRYVFHPIVDRDGKMVAVECLSRIFYQGAGISPETFFSTASTEVKQEILIKQIGTINKNADWFRCNNIMVSVNIDDKTMDVLSLDFFEQYFNIADIIRFEVNENSSSLISKDARMWENEHHMSFWLDDFGAGFADLHSLSIYHFDLVKIDKYLLWKSMRDHSNKMSLMFLLCYLHENNYRVIVEGVETFQHKKFLEGYPYFALQGHLWPECNIAELTSSGNLIN